MGIPWIKSSLCHLLLAHAKRHIIGEESAFFIDAANAATKKQPTRFILRENPGSILYLMVKCRSHLLRTLFWSVCEVPRLFSNKFWLYKRWEYRRLCHLSAILSALWNEKSYIWYFHKVQEKTAWFSQSCFDIWIFQISLGIYHHGLFFMIFLLIAFW